MLIAIDHGNSSIKTKHADFPSGFVRNPSMPQMASDWIDFKGSTYVLSGSHLPYQRDKTQNDDYYILTLFAVAKELARAGIRNADVKLAVGLPPAHMRELKDAFYSYLVRDRKEVQFKYNGLEYNIRIIDAGIFPQAYPAVYDRYDEIEQMNKAYIVDIGGYTTDVLLLRNGRLDLSCCYSLESGVIKLYGRAASVLTSHFGGSFDESDIKCALCAMETLLSEEMRKAVIEAAESHTDALLNSLQTNDIDLSYAPSFFVGGGSQLLKPMLERSGRLKKATFITDTLANAKGYAAMANALFGEGQEQKNEQKIIFLVLASHEPERLCSG